MIPYETDPSLHDGEPAPALLDDGFSPPAADRGAAGGDGEDADAQRQPPVEAAR